MTLPKRKKLAWHERKALHALSGGVGAVVAGCAKVVPDLLTHAVGAGTVLGGAGLVFGLGTVALQWKKARADDAEVEASNDVTALSAGLHVLHGVLRALDAKRAGANDDATWKDRVRITVHRCEGDQLEQLLDYVGGNGGRPGRRFSNKSGVIGQAVLRKSAVHARRESKDKDGFIDELVNQYNFSRPEAYDLRDDRWSWMAVPLLQGNEVAGVVYLDSCDPKFFDRKRNVIAHACAGLAEYGRLHAR